jgi:sarcosine oxidase delta subunit
MAGNARYCFSVIQVMADGTERRYEISGRRYRSVWRKIAECAMFLESTRSIVIHEIVRRRSV